MKKYIENYVLKIIAFATLFTAVTIPLQAQKKGINRIDVKGKIVNERAEPVAATITVKGTQKATGTDALGEFTLFEVEDNATLQVSGININPFEIKVSGRTKLPSLIATTKITKDKEVIIEASTGYQVLKPNELNGSVVVIDNKTLNQQVGTNILNRLNGMASGLLFNIGKSNSNPQNNTGIAIRGQSTINGPLDPLIVLDGFIYEGNINNINPNDVENITLLKDAAAASLWGARAGNGVIVLTSKKGRLNQKMVVSINAAVIVQEKPNLLALPQMSSADYIEVEEQLFDKGYFNDRIDYQPYLSLTPAVEVLLKKRNNLITAGEAAAQLNKLKATDARTRYSKYVYQPAVTQQYGISLRGGSTSNAYTFSMAYDRNNTDLRSRYNKLNIKLDNSCQPLKKLRLEMGVYYTSSHSLSGLPAYNSIRVGERLVPYYDIADGKGQALSLATTYNPAYTDTAGGGKLLDWKYYPLSDYTQDRTSNDVQELYSRLGINYTLSRAFKIDLKYQYQLESSKNERLADLQSYQARNTINSFSQVDPLTGVIKYILAPGGIRTLGNAGVASQTLRGQLNFKKAWRAHALNAIAGTEQREVKGESDSYTAYGYNADPLTIAGTDFVNGYPDFIRGYPIGISGQPTASKTLFRFTSVYANASYIFKERYSISASARRDGSNIFGANTNDKWKPLWSVGAGWNIADEKFYHFSLIELLKLRTSFGYSGNVNLALSSQPIASYVGNESYTNYPFARIQNLNNPDLRWEQSRQVNIGLDFGFRKNILSGSLDVYKKEGIDLYGASLFDYTAAGFTDVVTKNVANSKSTGIDLVLNSTLINRKIKWAASLLWNYNKTITTKYYSPNANQAHILLGGGNTIIPVVGKDLYGMVAYKWGGLDAWGNPQGYLNGQLSTDYVGIGNEIAAKELKSGSMVYIGSGSPHFFGSFINTVSWKQFSLSCNLAYKFGYYFFKSSINYDALINAGGGHSDYAKRWQKPGDEAFTQIPSFIYPNDANRDNLYLNSSVNVLKGAHIRLQYINLSYAPVLKRRSKTTFSGMELYANAANLGILWRANKEKIDPDYPASLNPAKIWAMGIRCNF